MVDGVIVTNTSDGCLKVFIPKLGITTWAKDIDDVNDAVLESVLSYQIQSFRYGLKK